MKGPSRLASIATSLDDLESGMDASGRSAAAIQRDASALDRRVIAAAQSAPLVDSLLRHAKNIQVCARDQRELVRQLRTALGKLHEELNGAKRPLPRDGIRS